MISRAILQKPEKLFLFLALIFGLLLVFLVPPYQSPDEDAQLFRAYQVSEFQFVGEKVNNVPGGNLPKSLLGSTISFKSKLAFHPEARTGSAEILAETNRPLNPDDRMFIAFPTHTVYSPVAYIPQAVGVFIGRVFSLSPIYLMYLGRLFNLAAWILLIYWAIRLIPVQKWVMFLLALMPMTLFLASSLSIDAAAIGIAFLFTAYALRLAFSDSPSVESKQLWLMALLLAWLGQIKFPYILLGLLFFLIPMAKFGVSRLKYWVRGAGIFFAGVVSSGIWLALINNIGPSAYSLRPGVSAGEQLAHILANPFAFARLSFFSFYVSEIPTQLVGTLGWLDTWLSQFHTVLYFALLVVTAVIGASQKVSLTRGQRTLLAAVFFLVSFGISTILYLTWTPVGDGQILGLQGRYFIPIAPLLFLLLLNRSVRYEGVIEKLHRFFAGGVIVSLILTLREILVRYYSG